MEHLLFMLIIVCRKGDCGGGFALVAARAQEHTVFWSNDVVFGFRETEPADVSEGRRSSQ